MAKWLNEPTVSGEGMMNSSIAGGNCNTVGGRNNRDE